MFVKKSELYKLFDMLDSYMFPHEYEEFFTKMVHLYFNDTDAINNDTKINIYLGENPHENDTNSLEWLLKQAVDETYFKKVDDNTYELYIDKDTYSDTTGRVGRAISKVAHCLENEFQRLNEIKDKVDYRKYDNYEIPAKIQSDISKRFGYDTLYNTQEIVAYLSEFHHRYNFFRSKTEFVANAMGTLYYGYNLEHYTKSVKDPERREWLEFQVWKIFEYQNEINSQTTFDKKIFSDMYTPYDIQTRLYQVLKMADRTPLWEQFTETLYDMAHCGKYLSKDFTVNYNILSNMKFHNTSNVSLKKINGTIEKQITSLKNTHEQNKSISRMYNNEEDIEEDIYDDMYSTLDNPLF